MKSILFGLALLCALPGCCGSWGCKDEPKKSCKTDCKSDKKSKQSDNVSKTMKKDSKNYKK